MCRLKRPANDRPSDSMDPPLKCVVVAVLCSLLVSVQALPLYRPEPYPQVKCQRATGRALQSFPIPLQKVLTQTWSGFAGIETENARFIVADSDFDWSLQDVEEKEELKVCPGLGEWTDLPRNAAAGVPLHAVIAEPGEKPWESHTVRLVDQCLCVRACVYTRLDGTHKGGLHVGVER